MIKDAAEVSSRRVALKASVATARAVYSQKRPKRAWQFVKLCGEADRDEDSDLILRSIAVAAWRSQCVSKDGGDSSARGHPSRRSHASACDLLEDEVGIFVSVGSTAKVHKL